MISVYCDSMNSRVLLDLHSLTSIEGSRGRLTVGYECICGQRGHLLTGRDRIGGGMSGHV